MEDEDVEDMELYNVLTAVDLEELCIWDRNLTIPK